MLDFALQVRKSELLSFHEDEAHLYLLEVRPSCSWVRIKTNMSLFGFLWN